MKTVLTKFVFGFFLFIATQGAVYAQFQYELKLSVNDKQTMNIVTEDIYSYNRYITDKMVFMSNAIYSEEYFDSIAQLNGLSLVSYKMLKGTIADPLMQTRACCTISGNIGSAPGDQQIVVTVNNVNHTTTAGSNSAQSFSVPYCDGQDLYISYWSSGGNASVSVSSPAGTLVTGSPLTQHGIVFYSNNACSSNVSLPAPNDCEGAVNVCSNQSFAGYPYGIGGQELHAGNRGCLLANERQSQWYYIYAETAGALSMTIAPSNLSTDYDFALWGPFNSANAAANCPPVTPPIRCNYSATTGNTGLHASATNASQPASGSQWSSILNVNPGEVYILLIDNYSVNTSPFNLNWGGTAGLGCVPITLPIELVSFEVNHQSSVNQIFWETAAERNNEYFMVERSGDGENWILVDKKPGAGTTNQFSQYTVYDTHFEPIVNYYRLTQVDFDGSSETFPMASIDNRQLTKQVIRITNLIGQDVDEAYCGPRIFLFSDGTTEKIFGENPK